MEVLWIMIPITIMIAIFFLGLFVWATHTGQFDDLVTPSHDIFLEDNEEEEERKEQKESTLCFNQPQRKQEGEVL